MLPADHHPHDEQWIRKQLLMLPAQYCQRAVDAYSEVYRAAHDAEQAPHRKDGAARFEANSRLRAYIAAILERLS